MENGRPNIRLTEGGQEGVKPMSRWQELLERQQSEERAGTADPATHAQERVRVREELEARRRPEGGRFLGAFIRRRHRDIQGEAKPQTHEPGAVP